MIIELKNRLDSLTGEYISVFEKKHGMVLDFWVTDEPGSVASFGDYYIDFSTIRYDLEADVPENLLIEWYDATLEGHAKGDHFVNYKSYINSVIKK